MGFPAGLESGFCGKDAVFDRADVQAQVATDATVVDRRGAGVFIPVDGLMASVKARDNTSAAADAFRLVDAGNDHEVAVEIVSWHDIGQGLADEVSQFVDAFFFHEV